MSFELQYRSVIRFLVLRGIKSSEIIQQLQEAYHDETPSQGTIYFWIQQFKSGRTSVNDDVRSGRPPEIAEKKLEILQNIVQNERRITKQTLAERLKVSYGSIHVMLKQLGIRKLCSRFVPHFLTMEMCANRLMCCQENMKLFELHGNQFLDNILTEDETSLSLYLPDDRRTSAEWKLPGEVATRKLKSGLNHKKAFMLSVFWNSRGIIHMDFAEKDVRITGEYYASLVLTARQKIRKPYRQNMYLLHDNAPVHKSRDSQAAIEQTGFIPLSHPPYSPDLAPSDYYLFSHLKKALKGRRFANKEELKLRTEEFFGNCSPDFYKKAFENLPIRWQKCIETLGSYIEK